MRLSAVGLLITFALAVAPLVAVAQPAGKTPRLGYLSPSSSESAVDSAFIRGLRDLGWVDGQTMIIEARYAGARSERFPEIARDLLSRGVDVLAVWGPEAVAAVMRATTSIPIVGLSMGDPVAAGFVANLARPGGNVTGVTDLHQDLIPKRVEVLKETVPGIRHLAVLANPASPSTQRASRSVTLAARSAWRSSCSMSPPRRSWRAPSPRSLVGGPTPSWCCRMECSGRSGRRS